MGLVFSLNSALPASQTPFCFSSNQNEAPSQFFGLFALSCLLLYPEFIAVGLLSTILLLVFSFVAVHHTRNLEYLFP